MTEADRIARASRAKAAFDEFLEPMFAELDSEYSARIIDVANTELLFWRRTGKLSRLADAIRTVATLKSGMQAIIADGDAARSEKDRKDKIKAMTEPQRRLLKIGPGY